MNVNGEMPPKHLGLALHAGLILCIAALLLHDMATKGDLSSYGWYRGVLGIALIANGLFALIFPSEITKWNEKFFASSRKDSPALSGMFLPQSYEKPGWRACARSGGIFLFVFGVGLCIGVIK